MAGLPADKAFARKASVWTPGAAAINAETWIGQARGAQDAVCLWLGARVFAGLMLGGIVAAPVAAYLTKRLPARPLMIVVGIAIVALSSYTLYVAVS